MTGWFHGDAFIMNIINKTILRLRKLAQSMD
jgi:hypothetical protein